MEEPVQMPVLSQVLLDSVLLFYTGCFTPVDAAEHTIYEVHVGQQLLVTTN